MEKSTPLSLSPARSLVAVRSPFQKKSADALEQRSGVAPLFAVPCALRSAVRSLSLSAAAHSLSAVSATSPLSPPSSPTFSRRARHEISQSDSSLFRSGGLRNLFFPSPRPSVRPPVRSLWISVFRCIERSVRRPLFELGWGKRAEL